MLSLTGGGANLFNMPVVGHVETMHDVRLGVA